MAGGEVLLIYIIKSTFLVFLLLLALISDIKTYRIKNSITLSFMGIGLFFNTAVGGFNGFLEALCGITFPFLLLLLLYLSRMLGAGDIKLFCSIGALMGWRFILWDMAFAFLSGGVIALIIIVRQKNGLSRLRYMANYLKGCFLTLSILPYSDFSDTSDGSKMRFSFAVVVGTFIYYLLSCRLY